MARRVVQKDEVRVRQVVDAEDLGAMLKAERIRRGASQDELGALVGLTRQKIQQIEAGHPGIAVSTVLRVLADLGIQIIAVPVRPPDDTMADEATRQLFDQADELLRQPELGRASLTRSRP
ncbi:MAG: helix-turn-helix transcriptional regulator [Rhodopila sp.]